MMNLKLGTIVAAGASFALVVACAGGGGDANSPLRSPSAASRVLTSATAAGDPGDGVVNEGELEICKHGTTGDFDVTVDGVLHHFSLAEGQCEVVAVNKTQVAALTSLVSVSETSNPLFALLSLLRTDEGFQIGTQTDVITTSTPNDPITSIAVNGFHGTKLDYTNRVIPPPVCDFITFGRLIALINGQKVVISGNIGGNQPGGGILSEFHVEFNGVDNHVANVDTYGPIASGPLSGLTNSRMSTGTAKNGVAVEVRMWDGGEPGKGTDIVYVKLNGVEILGPNGQFLDQGNMQYHSNCRGPG